MKTFRSIRIFALNSEKSVFILWKTVKNDEYGRTPGQQRVEQIFCFLLNKTLFN